MCKWTSSSISLFGKNGRYKKSTRDSGDKGHMRILFIQSDHSCAEYLQGTLNTRAGKASRETKNLSSE